MGPMTTSEGGEGPHDEGSPAAEDAASETVAPAADDEDRPAGDAPPSGADGDGPRNEWSTNEEFAAYISDELSLHPLSTEYPEVFAAAPGAICRWRERFRSNAPLWRRIFKKQQVIKEIIEVRRELSLFVRLCHSFVHRFVPPRGRPCPS